MSYNVTYCLGSSFGAVLQWGRFPREKNVKTGKHPEDLLRLSYRMSDVLAVGEDSDDSISPSVRYDTVT